MVWVAFDVDMIITLQESMVHLRGYGGWAFQRNHPMQVYLNSIKNSIQMSKLIYVKTAADPPACGGRESGDQMEARQTNFCWLVRSLVWGGELL